MEIGKVYDVVTQRKGNFIIQITSQDDTWATGIIVNGGNKYEVGDLLTFRKSFATFLEIYNK